MSEPFVHRGVQISLHRRRWRWRLQIDRQRLVRSAPTLPEAIELLDRHLDDCERSDERARAAARNPMSIADLCDSWFLDKRPQLAPSTAASYEMHIAVHIRAVIGETDANKVRPKELTAFYATRRWKAAKESHNILRQAFEWGLANQVLARAGNPCLVVRPSRRTSTDHDGYFDYDGRILPVDEKDIPTRLEVEKLLIDAETVRNRSWWLYLKLATATGARPGEICALRRRDVDLVRRTVRIEWSADTISKRLKRPKTRWSVRTVQLAPELVESIAELLPDDPDAFLFPSNTYKGNRSVLPCWHARSVKRRLDEALARIGLRHITPHSFRHFVATELLADGKSPAQVGRFLGHANDTLVRTLYGKHIVDDAQREIGEAASRLV